MLGQFKLRMLCRAEGGWVPPPAYRQAGGAVQGRFLFLLSDLSHPKSWDHHRNERWRIPELMDTIALSKREEEQDILGTLPVRGN